MPLFVEGLPDSKSPAGRSVTCGSQSPPDHFVGESVMGSITEFIGHMTALPVGVQDCLLEASYYKCC